MEDDEQYTIEKEAKSFEDYLELVRKTGGILAVMDPWSGIPRFVLSYGEDGIKFYPNYSKSLSRYYDFNPDVDPRRFADVLYRGSVSQDYHGKFKEDEVDDIILQEHPVRVDLRKLPDDVELVAGGGDDDEDDDRGGGRLPTMKEILEKWHKELNEIYDGEESEEPEKKAFEGLFMGTEG